ncbi:MAG: lamin tail domain-containing protein [Candidatus Marinimicrobia bacterium]|nr:lamin tail domain-containing protein [Candidatus Neomarinimicrobiota bacterium]
MKVIDTITRTSVTLVVIALLAITATAQDKLLITELVVTPTGGEFIEIQNLNGFAVDLTNYYITDATFAGGPTYYYQVVWGPDSLGVRGGGGSFSDWNARFPNGASIGAVEIQTIALNGSQNFFAEYGVNPTYELYEDSTADDAIPNMLEADTAGNGSINGQGGLSSNEVIILYYWDRMTDLVTDLDYLNYGGNDEQVDKTGVMIDGPDADATTSAYANDVAWADQDQAPAHGLGLSTQRIDFSEGAQVMFGGNGVGGSDETSEDWSVTFHADSAATPNEAPQVIVIPLITKLLLSEVVVDPTAGEFVEIYNPSSDSTVDLTNYYLTDATFQGGNTYYYQVVFGPDSIGVQGGGGAFGDWNAKFPDGASIAPDEYQTVALNGSANFFAEYGVNPTYELYEDSSAADAIPDMMEADTAGSINGQGGMTNGDEVVIFYFWDGVSDLVVDIDILNYGGNNEQIDKTGVEIDGPDAGSDSSAYAADLPFADQDQADVHALGFSMQRIDMDEGIQINDGSNGVAGRSETSENFSVTWYAMAGPTPNEPNDVDYVELSIADMEVDADGDFQPDRLGQMVRIHGVISTPNLQTSNTSHYLDDGTAGTDMFYFGQDSTFYMGDSVSIEGVVAYFAGVSEIIPVGGSAVTWLAFDAEIRVQEVAVNVINDVVGEDVEGEIVFLEEPVWQVDEAQWPSGISSLDLWITNGPDTVKMRLDSDIGLGGDPRPCGEFYLTGVVSQFPSNNPPNDNYSVIPRGFEDMVLLDAAVITSIDDLGSEIEITFSASARDSANADDPLTEYVAWAFYDDDSEDSLGLVTADNSAEYTLTATDPAQHAHIIVIANSEAGCGLWSEIYEYDDIVAVGDEKVIPETYDLSANYPNPFNPTTKINYQLKENTQVKIVVFNLLGEQVATLVDGEQTAGVYITEWNGLSDSRKVLASGIYFYRMTAGDFTKTNKMILLK